jgi:hypothetical protein
MNKHILLLSLSILFLLQACSKDINRTAEQKDSSNSNDSYNRTAEQKDSSNSNDSYNTNTLSDNSMTANSLYQKLYKEFTDRGLSNKQSQARAKIGLEVYQGQPNRIVFNGGHFYYVDGAGKRYEGQTYANCSIYALIRLLKHLGQCGYIDEDFWKQYSDEDLRIRIDNIGGRGKGYYINQNQYIVPLTLNRLMLTLLPNHHNYCEIYKPNGEVVNYY